MHDVEELRYHRGHSSKMAGPEGTFEVSSYITNIDPSAESGGIHFRWFGSKRQVYAFPA